MRTWDRETQHGPLSGRIGAMASTSDQPTVLAVQNTPDGGPGRLRTWLEDAGVAVEVIAAHADETLPEHLRHQGLIVLGGGMLPDDDQRGPWLPRTRELTRQALEHEIPMLGICLGGQLLAHVAGGRVEGNHGPPEYGSTQIELRPEAGTDRVFADLPPIVSAIEHHVDAITSIPSGTVWLAQSERCPYQAIRVGECAWGTQFHPEATVENVRRWEPSGVREAGFNPDELIARAQADEEAATAVWRRLAGRFADLVKSVPVASVGGG
jgi:GMP synthase (glutamine-hydrolysing)